MMKDHIKVLLMGDDGVGKSSLMVSITSNYFPLNVSKVLEDAMIPIACNANGTCITLMDSSSDLRERENLKQKLLLADSIILLFDVTRMDTLRNITDVWIPLLLEMQQGNSILKPAIIVGTKIDLIDTKNVEDESLVGLIMRQYPFIVMYMHCSAQRLDNIHEVISYAESIATFPMAPIYDVVNEEFTFSSRQAFQRIFRIFDLDHDNLLNDYEICNSQLKCFNLEITQEEVNSLKRKIYETVNGGLSQNALTFEGFLGLMTLVGDVTIPWTILHQYGYSSLDGHSLHLNIPSELSQLPKPLKSDQIYELSKDAKDFLYGLAYNAYQENARPLKPDSLNDNHSELEDCLTSEALRWILSVLPSDYSTNPWNHPPVYQTPWPYHNTIIQSILLPGLSHEHAMITFDQWLTQWHLLAFSDPILVQNLLFRLGYVDHQDNGIVLSSSSLTCLTQQIQLRKQSLTNNSNSNNNKKKSATTTTASSSSSSSWFTTKPVSEIVPRQTLNIHVLGDNSVGKSSFVFAMSGLRPPGSSNNHHSYQEDIEQGDIEYTKAIITAGDVIIGGYTDSLYKKTLSPSSTTTTTPTTSSSNASNSNNNSNNTMMHLISPVTHPFYLALTAIPIDHLHIWKDNTTTNKNNNSNNNNNSTHPNCLSQCDIVLLVYQCDDLKSLQTVMDIEKLLPATLPRLYLANKTDLLHHPSNPIMSNNPSYEKVLQKITLHTQDEQLLPVIPISVIANEGLGETMQAIRSIIQQPDIAIPKKETQVTMPFYQQPLFLAISAAVSAFSLVSLSVLLVKYNQEMKQWVEEFLQTTAALTSSSSAASSWWSWLLNVPKPATAS